MSTINDRFLELTNALQKKYGLSKTAIASKLNVSQQYISKLTKTGNPSDLFVSSLCSEYDVDKDWLLYRKNKMFIERSRNEIVADFMTDLLKDEESSFRKRLIEALASLDSSDWEDLERIATKLIKKDQMKLVQTTFNDTVYNA